jgi:5-methylcytosine-specific restriction endonuclease McrA
MDSGVVVRILVLASIVVWISPICSMLERVFMLICLLVVWLFRVLRKNSDCSSVTDYLKATKINKIRNVNPHDKKLTEIKYQPPVVWTEDLDINADIIYGPPVVWIADLNKPLNDKKLTEKKNHIEQEKKKIEIKHQPRLLKNNQKTTNNQTKRTCKKCDQMYPLNEDYFGYTPSGNFRYSCRKCMSLAAKKHDKENPDMVKKRQAQRKQRITKSQLARDYSPKDLKIKLYALSNGKCHYCKKSFKQDNLDLEHQIPVVQDGPDIQSNIVLACGFCNKEKHGKTESQYRQWLQERGRDIKF